MRLRFGFRDNQEDLLCQRIRAFAHLTAVDDCVYIIEIAVFMLMLVMFMMMMMQLYVEIISANAIRFVLADRIVEAFELNAFQHGIKLLAARTQCEQRRDCHVSGDAGRSFQIEDM